MKKEIIQTSWNVLCFISMFLCLVGCRCSDDTEIIQLVHSGHFVVTNVNSGATITVIGDNSNTEKLNANLGDVIKMQYVPVEQYKDLDYQVSFTINGGDIYKASAPDYLFEYKLQDTTPGEIIITMTAIVNETNKQATSFAACTLVVAE